MNRFLSCVNVLTLAAMGLLVASCNSTGNKPEKGEDFDKVIVVNEVMASNNTGLQSEDGSFHDWLEIKNISDKTLSLEDYVLASEQVKKDDSKDDDKKDKKDKAAVPDSLKETEIVEWEMPDVDIKPGECVVVFASKDESDDNDTELHANFKLPGKDGHVMLLRRGKILSEVSYDKLSADQVCRRRDDGTYEMSFFPTPGADNDEKGYEEYCNKTGAARKSPILIWEVMSRADKDSFNWVELKNVSTSPVDLKDYALTTDMDKKDKPGKSCSLPAVTVNPGEVYTVSLAGKKAIAERPEQVPIKLGNAETLILMKGGKFVDGVCAKGTYRGTSMGRVDGRNGFFYFAAPTKGVAANGSPCRMVAPFPTLDKEAGVYAKDSTLTLHLNTYGRKVHYTLDGSEPGPGSKEYVDSITLTKSAVVRLYAEGRDSSELRSAVHTSSYILNADHTLGVISISVNPSDLYSESSGIYAKGPGFNAEWPHKGANYWKPWTKRAHVEFYDNKKGFKKAFSTDCGLKIFGGFSRAEEKKSFCVKFDNMYGESEIKYDYYGRGEEVELKRFVLRSGSQDYNRCMIRDEFFTSLMRANSPTLLIQDYRPVAIYINGDYFGLYYIREKIDKNFVARNLKSSNDSITILMSKCYNEEGSSVRFRELLSYVASHDCSQKEPYEYVKSQVDLVGLIDEAFGELYSANTDLGNVRYVCTADKGCDNRWFFVYYDLDASWVSYQPLSKYLHPAQNNVAMQTSITHGLLHNKEFRQLLLERASLHLHKTFDPKNANAVFDNLVNTIRPEMKLNCKRWPNLSYEKWEKNIADFRLKIQDKHKLILNDLRQELNVTPEENKKYFGDLGY